MSGLVKSTCDGPCAGWLASYPAASAQPAGRTADAILDDLKDLESKAPARPDEKQRKDKEFLKNISPRLQELANKKAELALELYKVAPDHEQIPETDGRAVEDSFRAATKTDEMIKEIEDVLAKTKNARLKLEGRTPRPRSSWPRAARVALPISPGSTISSSWPPRILGAASLLYSATYAVEDKPAKAALEDRILKDYPDSNYVGMIIGARRKERRDRQAI